MRGRAKREWGGTEGGRKHRERGRKEKEGEEEGAPHLAPAAAAGELGASSPVACRRSVSCVRAIGAGVVRLTFVTTLKGEEREREETREEGRERMGKQGREGGDEGGRDRTFDQGSCERLRPPPAPSASFLCPPPIIREHKQSSGRRSKGS